MSDTTAHPSPPDIGIARVPPHSTHLPARLSGLIVVAERSGQCLNLHPWEDTRMAGVRHSSRARSPSLTAAAYHRSLPPRLPPFPLPFPRRGAPLPSGTCRIAPLSPIPSETECTLGELLARCGMFECQRANPHVPCSCPCSSAPGSTDCPGACGHPPCLRRAHARRTLPPTTTRGEHICNQQPRGEHICNQQRTLYLDGRFGFRRQCDHGHTRLGGRHRRILLAVMEVLDSNVCE